MRVLGFVEAYREYEVRGIRCVHDPEDARHGDVMLCGHVHNRWDEPHRTDGALLINVGVDVRGFRPMPLEDIFRPPSP